MRRFLMLRFATLLTVACGWLVSPAPLAANQPEDPPHGGQEHGSAHAAQSEPAADDSGAHGGPHDETDLGHQNASSDLESPTELKSDLALWTFVVFLCLLALLGKFAWGPVVAGLDRRERAIAARIEEAQRSADEAAQRLQQYEAKLAAAGEEAREMVAEARREAEGAKERILAEAQQAAQRERDRAISDIQAAKNNVLHELTERSADLAVTMASRMLQRQMTSEDHSQLIRESLEQLPSRN